MNGAHENRMTKLSEALSTRLKERNMEILDLAKATGMSYEHTRGLLRGLRPPSKFFLKEACRVLKLNYEEMYALERLDEVKKKYGDVLPTLTGKNPTLEPLEEVWEYLSKDQQQDIVAMAQGWAKRSRKSL